MLSVRLTLHRRAFSDTHPKYLMMRRRQRRARKGASAQNPSEKILTPWTFSVKFPYDTQFTFGSLIFTVGEDENLKLLTQGPAPKLLAPVYGQAPYLLASSSTSGSTCLGLNPYAGPYHHAAKTI
jgi:hypothetical protein